MKLYGKEHKSYGPKQKFVWPISFSDWSRVYLISLTFFFFISVSLRLTICAFFLLFSFSLNCCVYQTNVTLFSGGNCCNFPNGNEIFHAIKQFIWLCGYFGLNSYISNWMLKSKACFVNSFSVNYRCCCRCCRRQQRTKEEKKEKTICNLQRFFFLAWLGAFHFRIWIKRQLTFDQTVNKDCVMINGFRNECQTIGHDFISNSTM